MAPTSDERRELAARLRVYAQLRNFCTFEAFFVRLNMILFGDNGWDRPDGDVFEHLADLIDPTCRAVEKGHPDEYHVCYGCNACDFGWYEDVHDEPYAYCPHCGARVVRDDD